MVSDPLFFLHHGQVDRLWWLWQQQDKSRLREYSGSSGIRLKEDAQLDDVLPMYGLAPDRPVSDIMDTEAGILCYRYD
jgi:tyrosinase